MAKQDVAAVDSKPGLVARVTEFYHDVMGEMKKVTWPTKEELKGNTQVVLLVLFMTGAIIYVYDIVFQYLVIGLFRWIGS